MLVVVDDMEGGMWNGLSDPNVPWEAIIYATFLRFSWRYIVGGLKTAAVSGLNPTSTFA